MLRFKVCNLYTTFSSVFELSTTRLKSHGAFLSPYLASLKRDASSSVDSSDNGEKQTKFQGVEFNSKSKELGIVELHVPTKLRKTDVLVKVVYAGICGSDLHIIRGDIAAGDVILGHELCGIVEKTGTEVFTVKPGDHVVVDPNSGCGTCTYCAAGNYHYCPHGGLQNAIGLFRNGGWAEFCLAPAQQVFKIPEAIPLKHAVLIEPMSCISHGWDKIQPLTIGKKILILGAGIAGLLYSCLFHLHGHTAVTVCEPHKDRRRIFNELGTDYLIISPRKLKTRQKDPCWGVDVVVDCSGNGPAMEEAFRMLNPGGVLSVYGLASPGTTISISPLRLFQRELTIHAVLVNPHCIYKAVRFIEALGDRYLNYETLGIKEFKLTEYKEAIEAMEIGSVSKAMFSMQC